MALLRPQKERIIFGTSEQFGVGRPFGGEAITYASRCLWEQLLFSLALRRVWAETLRGCSPRAWGAFSLDDGVLAGNVAAVHSTFDAFRTACSRHGLRINTGKCVVAPPSHSDPRQGHRTLQPTRGVN